MTQFENDVTRQLGKMEQGITDILKALERDYHHLHGNGTPGLIERVSKLEEWQRSVSRHYGAIVATAAFLINLAVTLYIAYKKH